MAEVTIYTDGACSGNPGKGGYGIVMVHVPTSFKRCFFGFDPQTTNIQMELQAIVQGLAQIKRKGVTVEVITDCEPCVRWMTGEYKARDERVKAKVLHINSIINDKGLKVTFTHVKKASADDIHETAHNIAQWATKSGVSTKATFGECYPGSLANALPSWAIPSTTQPTQSPEPV